MEVGIPAFAGMTGRGGVKWGGARGDGSGWRYGGWLGNGGWDSPPYGAGRGEMAPRLRGGFGWGAGVTGVVGVMGVWLGNGDWDSRVRGNDGGGGAGMTGWGGGRGWIPAFAGMTGGMRRLALRGLVAVWRL